MKISNAGAALVWFLVFMAASCDEVEEPAPAPSFLEVVKVEWFPTGPGGKMLITDGYAINLHVGAGVVQELTFHEAATGQTGTLVEYFGHERAIDRHSGTLSDWHLMKIYPGSVADVDADANGYAMLPQNLDGSFTTNIPPGSMFNHQHLASHAIQGCVDTADPSSAVTWIVQGGYRNGALGLVLTIDGNEMFFPAPH